MNSHAERREDSFVVRIWREGLKTPRWRASVTHVGSRQLRYFTNYGDLCEFLDRWAEPTEPEGEP